MASIETSLTDGIRTISFNGLDVHNAFDDEMPEAILTAFEEARDCRESRVVILRGNGHSFCASRDMRAMGERKPGVTHFQFLSHGQQNIRVLIDIDKPVIAAAKGLVKEIWPEGARPSDASSRSNWCCTVRKNSRSSTRTAETLGQRKRQHERRALKRKLVPLPGRSASALTGAS